MKRMQTGRAIGPLSPGVTDLQIQHSCISFNAQSSDLDTLFRSIISNPPEDIYRIRSPLRKTLTSKIAKNEIHFYTLPWCNVRFGSTCKNFYCYWNYRYINREWAFMG